MDNSETITRYRVVSVPGHEADYPKDLRCQTCDQPVPPVTIDFLGHFGYPAVVLGRSRTGTGYWLMSFCSDRCLLSFVSSIEA